MNFPPIIIRNSYNEGISSSFEKSFSKTPIPKLPRIRALSQRNSSNQITIRSRNSNHSQHYSEISDEIDIKLRHHLEAKDALIKQYTFQSNKKQELEEKIKKKERKERLSLQLQKVYGYSFDKDIYRLEDEEMIQKASDFYKEKKSFLGIVKFQRMWHQHFIKNKIQIEKIKINSAARKIQNCWLDYYRKAVLPRKLLEKRIKAATIIQKYIRGYFQRQSYLLYKHQKNLALAFKYMEDFKNKILEKNTIIIQRNWRSYKLRQSIAKRLERKRKKRNVIPLRTLKRENTEFDGKTSNDNSPRRHNQDSSPRKINFDDNKPFESSPRKINIENSPKKLNLDNSPRKFEDTLRKSKEDIPPLRIKPENSPKKSKSKAEDYGKKPKKEKHGLIKLIKPTSPKKKPKKII
ncbi:unnamed protein product [Blepharisma stoltei]|uniref:Uncharacterized protein n=1 Tax=Blepharisma stoltei TaxID=1481888 RepID=A0AAU9KAF7_9CILI|nr:unnamed protein product [Blepharisma stoltei]